MSEKIEISANILKFKIRELELMMEGNKSIIKHCKNMNIIIKKEILRNKELLKGVK